MKRTILVLILFAVSVMAINLTYPNDLAWNLNDAVEDFLREYERACQDSVEVMGVWIETPAVVRSALLAKAASKRLEVIETWNALNDYIMDR